MDSAQLAGTVVTLLVTANPVAANANMSIQLDAAFAEEIPAAIHGDGKSRSARTPRLSTADTVTTASARVSVGNDSSHDWM